MRSIFFSFVLFFVIIGCKKSAETVSSDTEMMTIKLPPKEAAVASDNFTMNAQTPAKIETKIIKEGNLRFETNDLESTYNQIQSAVKKHQASIQNDSEGKDYESIFRNITVRIPSENFDVFLTDISKGVGYFDRKEISAQDVTEQYIDIEARLKTKKALELRYLDLLKKANKVSEMLEIEKQLSEIREEIEAKEGQLKYMQQRVSMSTVTIEFYKRVAEKSGITVSYGTKIWNALKSGFNGISSFFIGLLHVWPFIIILVGLIYFIRKRFKNKKL